MRWMALASVVTVLLALIYLKWSGEPVPLHMAIATIAGVGLTMLVGTGLMGLLFVSNRSSHTLCAIDTESMTVRRSAASRNDVTRINRARDGRLFTSNYGDRSLSVVDPDSLQETGYLPLEARAIALSFHPTKPLAFVSQDDDRVAVLDTARLRIERYIATRREPDVSKVVVL